MKATTRAATMPPTSLTTITATTIDVLNATHLQVTRVDGARGVYVPFAVLQRESSKWLGGARSVTKKQSRFNQMLIREGTYSSGDEDKE